MQAFLLHCLSLQALRRGAVRRRKGLVSKKNAAFWKNPEKSWSNLAKIQQIFGKICDILQKNSKISAKNSAIFNEKIEMNGAIFILAIFSLQPPFAEVLSSVLRTA